MAADDPQETSAMPRLAEYYATQHVLDQEGLAEKAKTGLALLWPIIKFDDLSGSAKPWLHSVTLQIQQIWNDSAAKAFDFVQASKWSVEPESSPLVQASVDFPVQEVQTSMQVRGPVAVKQAIERARPESEAMQAGKAASTSVGATKATDGGRSQVLQQVTSDAASRLKQGKVIGYARKTDSNPCYFCALLASQGAVYYGDDSFSQSNTSIREVKWTSAGDKGARRAFIGDGPAKVHDNCQCIMRPVYSKSDSRDDRAKYFLAQWEKSNGSVKDFRNRYVPPPPYDTSMSGADRKQLIADVQRNREALLSQGFRASSPNVKFLDSSIKKLQAT